MDINDDEEHPQSGENGQGYAWEEEYKRSWDILMEDDSGSLQGMVATMQQQLLLKRRRLRKETESAIVVQRGIIRQIIIVIDLSAAMAELDLRPNRLDCTLNFLEMFVVEFFDQNPLSHLGIIGTKDGMVEKWAELSGNPSEILKALTKRSNRETAGEPSLQNALELARRSLAHVPMHVSREIIVLYGSLTSCDPGDIQETINDLCKENIRVSVIGLAAEVQVCKKMCASTNGVYNVIMNDVHYKEILFAHIPPPPLLQTQLSASNIIQMGFPMMKIFDDMVLCSCHQNPIQKGHICPRCSATICNIPTDCCLCSLTLISSPSLARSYHHLFPVPNFTEIPPVQSTSYPSQVECFSCQTPFSRPRAPGESTGHPRSSMTSFHSGTYMIPTARYACPRCKVHVCLDCDVYIHDTLHNCPGCMSGFS
ncbi:hypothetical protein BDV3_005089 [Batrachochytrium dendrobatidis]|uniref:General transcription and DNA repair factor IIH n=1 Tax=Batrachochytrium dendrobatidis (strain JEL423) TaxID=403673 RepID=A0A177WLQ6_BATDL|nr:hypothetical protein QVD99_002485 [Batrachochytrium dendrobatidis]OAJ40625.1 hypothetical protein BDEG_24334 [Batrachochytrium dendrobatidis JEL423]